MGIQNPWSFVVTNPDFEAQGEFVDVHSSAVGIPLNKTNTASVTVRLDNVLAPYIASSVSKEPLYLKGYRAGKLLFFGPIMTMQESYSEDQKALLQINAAGPEVIFTQRLAGKTAAGIKFAAGTQLALRFKELLNTSNSATNGETHIDYTTGPISSTNVGAYESPPLRLLSEVLTDMYNQANGFDWNVYPQEPTASKIGKLVIKDVIGETSSNALFEWGIGAANIATYTRTADLTNLLNSPFNVTSGGPEATGAPMLTLANAEAALKAEAEALQKTFGLREGVVSLQVLVEALRKTFMEETLNVRMRPRQTITMQPVVQLEGEEHNRVPILGTDYNVGDSVPIRIGYEGEVHFSGLARVWGVSFAQDENGKETQTITLSDS